MPEKRSGATYYSVSELAASLGVHRNSVLYWISIGKIKAERVGLSDKSPYKIKETEYKRVLREIAASS